jgi:hypothetical protein
MSRDEDPVSCFRCYDMKVVDPATLDSIESLLIELHLRIEHLYDRTEQLPDEDLMDKINRHIILLQSMPDE